MLINETCVEKPEANEKRDEMRSTHCHDIVEKFHQ